MTALVSIKRDLARTWRETRLLAGDRRMQRTLALGTSSLAALFLSGCATLMPTVADMETGAAFNAYVCTQVSNSSLFIGGILVLVFVITAAAWAISRGLVAFARNDETIRAASGTYTVTFWIFIGLFTLITIAFGLFSQMGVAMGTCTLLGITGG